MYWSEHLSLALTLCSMKSSYISGNDHLHFTVNHKTVGGLSNCGHIEVARSAIISVLLPPSR